MTTTGDPEPMYLPHDHIEITAYLEYLARAGHPATTIRTYRYPLMRASRDLPHGLCSEPEDIQAWLAAFPGRNTRASYQTALRGFYRWALRTRRITADPTADLPVHQVRRGLPRPVSHAELAAILTGARPRVRLWCQLAAYAGMRCVEIARVERRDVTPEVVYLHGKGDKERLVPTHPELWAAVQPLGPGRLAPLTPKSVSKAISRECRRLGMTGVTAHRLRHWAGTWWQAATGDVRVTQQLLGHASPTTTAVYTAVSDASLRAAVLGLPRINGAATGDGGPGG